MASDVDNVCASDPNFAAICSFIDQFGDLLGFGDISFEAIKNFLGNSSEDANLKEILIKLLRRAGQRCDNEDKLQKSLGKFLQKRSQLDAWEVERFGFPHADMATKIRSLKLLLEAQFDKNSKFKEKVNERTSAELRLKPAGRDKNGMSYWYLLDKEANLLVYREEQDSEDKEGFKLVCTNRDELATLITNLQENGDELSVKSEDSQSVTSNASEKAAEAKEEETGLSTHKEENVTQEASCIGEEAESVKTEMKSEVKEKKVEVKVKLENEGEETSENEKLTNGDKKNDKETDDNEDCKVEIAETDEDGEKSMEERVDMDSQDRVNGRRSVDKVEKAEEALDTAGNVDTSVEVAIDLSAKSAISKPENSNILGVFEQPVDCTSAPVESSSSSHAIDPPVGSPRPVGSPSRPVGSPSRPLGSPSRPAGSPSRLVDSERSERPDKCLKRGEEVEKEDEIPAKARRRSDGAGTPTIVVTDTSNREKVLLDKPESPKSADPSKGETEAERIVSMEQIATKGSEDNVMEPVRETQDDSIPHASKEEEETKSSCEALPSDMQEDTDEPSEERMVEKSDTETGADDAEKVEAAREDLSTNADGVGKTMAEMTEIEEQALEKDQLEPPADGDRASVERENGKESISTAEELPQENPDNGDITESTSNNVDEAAEAKEPEDAVSTQISPKKGKRRREKVEIPVEHLRRSTRAQKKRKIIDEEIENIPPIKASRKNKHQSSPSKSSGKKRRGDRGDRAAGSSSDSDAPLSRIRSKRTREKSKETSGAKFRKLGEESSKKKSKRKKADSDEDFSVNGKQKGRKRRKSSGSSESSSDLLDEGSESEELLFGVSSDSDEFVGEDSDSDFDPSKVKKGRNARRQEARQEKAAPAEDDKPCQLCQKHEHPEWILLCDTCDDGYHTTCLRPPLMLIPEGDWFCPPCEHKVLIETLSGRLKQLDQQLKKREHLVIRRERLAFINVNLDNILKEGGREEVIFHSKNKKKKKKKKNKREKRRSPSPYQRRSRRIKERYVSDESGEESYEEEIVYTRSTRRRKEINYHFDDYDQLIDEAIGDEVKAVQACPKPGPKPGRSRGKDMANIEGMGPVEDERPPGVMTGRGRRKGRRLTCLDVDDDGSNDESEEYKASEDSVSYVESEDDSFIDDVDSESGSGSDDEVIRSSRRTAGRKSKGGRFARYRADGFVVDSDGDSDDYREQARPTRRSARVRVDYRDRDSDTSDEIIKKLAPKKDKKKSKRRKSDSDFHASDQSATEVEEVVTDVSEESQTEKSTAEVSPKSKHNKYEDDSDFSGHVPSKMKKAYKHKAKLYKKVTQKQHNEKAKKRVDSSPDGSESEGASKKSKKKNVIESDSEAGSDKGESDRESVDDANKNEKAESPEKTAAKKDVSADTGPSGEAEDKQDNEDENEDENEEGDDDEEDSEGDMHVISKNPKPKPKLVAVKKEPGSKTAQPEALKLKTEVVTEKQPTQTAAVVEKESVVKETVTKPPAVVKKEVTEKARVPKPAVSVASAAPPVQTATSVSPVVSLPIIKREVIDTPPEQVHSPPSLSVPVPKQELERRQSSPIPHAPPPRPTLIKPEPRDVNSPVHSLPHIPIHPQMAPTNLSNIKPEQRDSCQGSPILRRDSPKMKPNVQGSPLRNTSPGPVHVSPGPVHASPGSVHASPGPVHVSPGPAVHIPHTSYASPPPQHNSGLISYRPQFGIMGHGSRHQAVSVNSQRRPDYPPPNYGPPIPGYPQYGPPPHISPHVMPRVMAPQYSGHLMEMQRMVPPSMDTHSLHHNGGVPHISQHVPVNSLPPHGIPIGPRFTMDGPRFPPHMDPNYRHLHMDRSNASPPMTGTPPTSSPHQQITQGLKREEEDLSEVSDLLSFVSGFERTSTS